MCGHTHLFIDIQETEDTHMSFGDSMKVPIIGRGKICFSRNDGKLGTMKDVYCVPNFKNNILSIGRLLEKRMFNFHKGSNVTLKDKRGRVLAHIEMTKNQMFKLNLKIKVISLRC